MSDITKATKLNRECRTRMNFCNEKSVNLKFLSALFRNFSAVSRASRPGAFTSLKCSTSVGPPAQTTQADAHLRLTLLLIFFRKFSLVTSSSVSSLNAKFLGGSLIFKLRQSCFITSSTVRVGSMRVLTVRPSAVVTLFVGTRVDLDTDPLEKLEGSRLGAPDITSDWSQ